MITFFSTLCSLTLHFSSCFSFPFFVSHWQNQLLLTNHRVKLQVSFRDLTAKESCWWSHSHSDTRGKELNMYLIKYGCATLGSGHYYICTQKWKKWKRKTHVTLFFLNTWHLHSIQCLKDHLNHDLKTHSNYFQKMCFFVFIMFLYHTNLDTSLTFPSKVFNPYLCSALNILVCYILVF